MRPRARAAIRSLEDAQDLDDLLRRRVHLLPTLSPLIVIFGCTDWLIRPERALVWLGYRIATVAALVGVIDPLARRIAPGAAYARLVAWMTVLSASFAAIAFESGGFASPYSVVFPLLCWASSIVAPLSARRALLLGLVPAAGWLAAGFAHGSSSVALAGFHAQVLVAGLLFTVLGGRLTSELYLDERRAEREARRLIRLLEESSRRDPLTGALNRRALEARVLGELARLERTAAPFALLVADLDHFKSTNDRFGHAAGDAQLVRASRAMQRVLRSHDELFRLGGDEFAAVLAGATAERAGAAAERLRRAVERVQFEVAGERVPCTVSVGFAEARAGETAEALLARADAALYRAKVAGRNRVGADASASPREGTATP